MKQSLLSLILSIFLCALQAQEVAKNILVEHFTNSLCSTCANRNSGFYNTLTPYTKAIHIAYHPSSPYMSCIFSQHNRLENDARTNYYGIYGGTPRVVVNGAVIPTGPSLVSTQTLDAQNSLTSPFDIEITQYQEGSDSMYCEIIVSTKANTAISAAKLYVLLSEQEVNYDAPNGEDLHHDVFRKFLADNLSFSLPSNGNDTTFYLGSKVDQDWVPQEITTTVFLQNSLTKEVLQAEQSEKLDFSTSISLYEIIDKVIYPNPAKDFIYINNEQKLLHKIEIYSIIGTLMQEVSINDKERVKIAVRDYDEGTYILRVYDFDNKVYTKKIVVDY